jgi:hypothetical protein
MITGHLVLLASTMYNLRERDGGRISQNSSDTFCGRRAALHTAPFESLAYRMTPASGLGGSNSVHPSALLG